jgi:ZIP family zinc transporter
MSTAQTLILGAVAGLTIFVGLPMGRVRSKSLALRASLGSIATGILVFLFWDVMTHGVAPVDSHLEAHAWGAFAGYAALLCVGFG